MKGRRSRCPSGTVVVPAAGPTVVEVVVTVEAGPAVDEVVEGTVELVVEEVLELVVDEVDDVEVDDVELDDEVEVEDELEVVEPPGTTKHAPPALRFSFEPAVVPPVSLA